MAHNINNVTTSYLSRLQDTIDDYRGIAAIFDEVCENAIVQLDDAIGDVYAATVIPRHAYRQMRMAISNLQAVVIYTVRHAVPGTMAHELEHSEYVTEFLGRQADGGGYWPGLHNDLHILHQLAEIFHDWLDVVLPMIDVICDHYGIADLIPDGLRQVMESRDYDNHTIIEDVHDDTNYLVRLQEIADDPKAVQRLFFDIGTQAINSLNPIIDQIPDDGYAARVVADNIRYVVRSLHHSLIPYRDKVDYNFGNILDDAVTVLRNIDMYIGQPSVGFEPLPDTDSIYGLVSIFHDWLDKVLPLIDRLENNNSNGDSSIPDYLRQFMESHDRDNHIIMEDVNDDTPGLYNFQNSLDDPGKVIEALGTVGRDAVRSLTQLANGAGGTPQHACNEMKQLIYSIRRCFNADGKIEQDNFDRLHSALCNISLMVAGVDNHARLPDADIGGVTRDMLEVMYEWLDRVVPMIDSLCMHHGEENIIPDSLRELTEDMNDDGDVLSEGYEDGLIEADKLEDIDCDVRRAGSVLYDFCADFRDKLSKNFTDRYRRDNDINHYESHICARTMGAVRYMLEMATSWGIGDLSKKGNPIGVIPDLEYIYRDIFQVIDHKLEHPGWSIDIPALLEMAHLYKDWCGTIVPIIMRVSAYHNINLGLTDEDINWLRLQTPTLDDYNIQQVQEAAMPDDVLSEDGLWHRRQRGGRRFDPDTPLDVVVDFINGNGYASRYDLQSFLDHLQVAIEAQVQQLRQESSETMSMGDQHGRQHGELHANWANKELSGICDLLLKVIVVIRRSQAQARSLDHARELLDRHLDRLSGAVHDFAESAPPGLTGVVDLVHVVAGAILHTCEVISDELFPMLWEQDDADYGIGE